MLPHTLTVNCFLSIGSQPFPLLWELGFRIPEWLRFKLRWLFQIPVNFHRTPGHHWPAACIMVPSPPSPLDWWPQRPRLKGALARFGPFTASCHPFQTSWCMAAGGVIPMLKLDQMDIQQNDDSSNTQNWGSMTSSCSSWLGWVVLAYSGYIM